MFTFQLQINFNSIRMAVYLSNMNVQLTALELTTIVNEINRFHQLNPAAPGYQTSLTTILLSLNQVVNPSGFEFTVTHMNTLIMVMMD